MCLLKRLYLQSILSLKNYVSLADNSKGHTMVGYMKRFSVTFRKAKELLDQGVLGSVISFDAYAYSSDFFGVQRDSVSGARGGVLEDLGSHVSDLALWFFGDLLSSVKVSSSTCSQNPILCTLKLLRRIILKANLMFLGLKRGIVCLNLD